ncbi:MAG: type 2 isopentenyl-diphosphate Delta-isomerase [Balneolaceae bacterium]|nr:type 2 isopentenyl-diphosphate Delta-isomerase [Balneolaceae bacterium]
MSIGRRKRDHVELSVSGEVDYTRATGFGDYRLLHEALPELDLEEVDTSCTLLGRTFDFPLFVSSMTGGYTEAGAVNAILAEFCEEYNLPMGVGSQRIMLEEPETASSFSVVRERAPGAFIAANIGGAQLVGGLPDEQVRLLTESIAADAVIVHLNPLQELMQPEGDRNFRGVEEGIARLVEQAGCPVIVKETGAGISARTGRSLLELGVQVLDTSGAGGTSWARIENLRQESGSARHDFDNWGIPTVTCVLGLQELRADYNFEMIASGGVRSAFDIAKAFCLGADFAAAAQPLIRAIHEDGADGLRKHYLGWREDLRTILLLTGCRTPAEWGPNHLRAVG